MRKSLLLIAALIIAAGAMAQDIYTAQTIYNNGDGTMYFQKNGVEIRNWGSSGYTYTCTDMITGGDGCVYFTVNSSANWTDIYRYNPSTNACDNIYNCPTGQGIKINDLAWYNGDIYGAGYYHGSETNREFGHVVKNGTVLYHFNESDYGTEFNGITIDQLGNIWTVGCENNSMGTATPDYAYGTVYKNGVYYAQVSTSTYSRFTDVEHFNGYLYLMGEMKVGNHWSGMLYSVSTSSTSFTQIKQIDNPNANYNVTFNKMAYDAYNIYMVGCIAGDHEYVWKYNYNTSTFSTLGTLGAPSSSAGIAASSSGIYAAYNGGKPVVGTGGSTFNLLNIQFTSDYNPSKITVVENVIPNKVYQLPFSEHFTYGSTTWDQWFIRDYDNNNGNRVSYWVRNDYNNSTDICASHTYGAESQSGDLASPMIRIPSNYSNITLGFNSRVKYPSFYPQNIDANSVYVLYADNEDLSYSNYDNHQQVKVWSMDDHMDLCHDAWEWVEIDLSAYKGHTISVVFYYDGGADAHQWLVDDIYIDGEYDGVKEEGENVALSVMPNPANDVIRVNGLNGTEEVNVYNTLGQVVKSARLSDGQSLSIEDLSAGVYMLRSEKSSQVVKFTVK